MERICIYPTDICIITGRKLRYSQRVLKNLKVILKKEPHQFVTKQELAKYLDIDPDSFKLR